MNKKYLLSSVTAGITLLYANQGMTQDCVQSQDCAALGYTESSCSGENGGVKCPFGDKWACYPEPYNSVECTVGTLYYSDGKCYDEYIDSKTLLGVVIYEKSASNSGWIMTVSPIETAIYWSSGFYDIPGLTKYTSTPTDIQASCTNTDIITAYGDSSTYPAAWAAKNYSPSGTPSGKSWCLPSGGLLNNLNNSVNFAKVNAGITTAGGSILGEVYNNGSYYFELVWSSSMHSKGYAWGGDVTSGSFISMKVYNLSSGYKGSVRPVMKF